MANTLKNLVRSLVAGTATAYITAGASPNRITIKRLRVTNINASGGATVNCSLWAGSAADDAHAICKAVPIGPGEALEFDPTMIVLEPTESLYALGSIASNLSLSADGLNQT